MLAPSLPKLWLVHSIKYFKKQSGRDEWGNPIKDEEVEIKNVRFDEASTFTRNITQDQVSINGVVFVDARHSAPIVEFVENSTIEFNGRKMVIHKVVPCYHPTSLKVHHWELEVV